MFDLLLFPNITFCGFLFIESFEELLFIVLLEPTTIVPPSVLTSIDLLFLLSTLLTAPIMKEFGVYCNVFL